MSRLPEFTKIASIVSDAEAAQGAYRPVLDRAHQEEVAAATARGVKPPNYASGWRSKYTVNSPPRHKLKWNDNTNQLELRQHPANPADRAAMTQEQQDLLDQFERSPRLAARVAVAARAYAGDSPRAPSPHPLVDHAPKISIFRDPVKAARLRWIGHRVTSLMEAAEPWHIKYSYAKTQDDQDGGPSWAERAKKYKLRAEQKEEKARRIGEKLRRKL